MAEIIVAGDSAGGNLVIAGMLALREKGAALPAGAVCIGPWVDLAVDGGSMITNAATDPIVIRAGMKAAGLRYLGDASPYLPLASPIYADLTGLPPLLIQVGSGEALLDDARRLAGRARACGVIVQLSEWHDMVHGWHMFEAWLGEAKAALQEIAGFTRSLGITA
jgi:acetyl esterase/lipase